MKRLRAVVAALSLMVPGWAAAEPVYLIYDEYGQGDTGQHGINDQDRASLMRLFCTAVPKSNWPSIMIDATAAAGTIIDRYFDYFPDGYQLTYQELTAQLLAANHLTPAQQPEMTDVPAGVVVLPPVPVRGLWREGKIRIRGFRLRSQGYSWLNDLAPEHLQLSDVRNLLPASKKNNPTPNPFHEGSVTVVEIESEETFLAAMDAAHLDALPPSVVLRTGNANPTVSLLQATPPTCTTTAPQLSDFPEGAALQQRLQSPQLADAMVAAAKNMPLVIIDFDFEAGHGAAVLDVIKSVLDPLHLWLALEPHIERIDFDRRQPAARSKLREILTEHEKSVAKAMRTEPLQKAFVRADAWVKGTTVNFDANGQVSLSQEINEQVFYALLWKYFTDRQAWVNMSFFIDAPEFRIIDGIAKSPSFAVIAAGNDDSQSVPDNRYPQAGAKLFDNFVNVTYGTRGGDICGSRHSNLIPVGLVAPGGGFTGSHITPQQNGSSFASPYVAAVSWLKRLTDGVSAATMRNVLMDSVEPSFAFLDPVASGGFFDGAAMLAFPGEVPPTHLVDVGGHIEPLTAGELTFFFRRNQQKEGVSIDFSNAPQGAMFTMFRCQSDPTRWCVWLRRSQNEGPITGEITQIDLTRPGHAELTNSDAVAAEVRLIRY
jgi:hypothetical protein